LNCDDANPATIDTCTAAKGCDHASVIPGTKLAMRGDAARAALMKIKVTTSGSIPLSTPPSNNGASDPVRHGGRLRVVAGTVDVTYPLPASNWAYIGRIGDNNGYRYTDLTAQDGPINTVVVRDPRTTLARGRGAGLALALTGNPNPVQIVLYLG